MRASYHYIVYYYRLTDPLAGCRVPTTGAHLLLNVVGRPVTTDTQSVRLVVTLSKA